MRINRDFNYFQSGLDSLDKVKFDPLIIQPNDIISITVSSNTANQEQVAIFNVTNNSGIPLNMPIAQQQGGGGLFGYLVDPQGYIEFPMLGKIKVAGYTRFGLQNHIKSELSTKGLVKEPNVIIRFTQIRINVLGEVRNPGTKLFFNDRISLLDALAAAGDLNERGRRDRIIIIREHEGSFKTIRASLLDAGFMNSEAFQLQQNDVVYVYANDIKLREAGVNPVVTRDIGLVSSVLSIFVLITNLILVVNK
jgi:polysaccharide export outer membrane protein